MADQAGWIKVHRQMLDSAVWTSGDIALFRVWMWCLLRASHRDRQAVVGNEVYDLEPGQFFTGRHKGADQCGIPASTFTDKMRLLEKMGNIRQEPDSVGTRVTVLNWATYQLSDFESRQQTDSDPTDPRQRPDTNNNDKKEKKEESDLFGHTRTRGGKRRNPKPEEMMWLIKGTYSHRWALDYAMKYWGHIAGLKEPLTFEQLEVLVNKHGWVKVWHAMMIVVSKGWRKLAKGIEYIDEQQADPKFKAASQKFSDMIQKQVEVPQ